MWNITRQTICLAMLAFLPLIASTAIGKTIYVDCDANGLNDGSSWANAFIYLQDALAIASNNDEIRVAEGIYKPDQGNGKTAGDREATFQLINGVALKGSYAGLGIPDPNVRNIDLYKTILSGDLKGDDEPNFANNADNSYHVVTSIDINDKTVLDGLVITAGNGGGGAGMSNYASNLEIKECLFTWNSGDDSGGGMVNVDSNIILTSCKFVGNISTRDGGAMLNAYNNLTLNNCIFIDNFAPLRGGAIFGYGNTYTVANSNFTDNTSYYGGAVYVYNGEEPNIVNCTFINNSAEYNGGGIYAAGAGPRIVGCTFTGNTAAHAGAGMQNDYGEPVIIDCTFLENSADLGGGMGNSGVSQEPPTLRNCAFSGNRARLGGGLFSTNSVDAAPTIENCMFKDNYAEVGAGMCNYQSSSPILKDCTFRSNLAVSSGGGMHNFDHSNPILTGCNFKANISAHSGGMGNYLNSSPLMTNCVFEGNRAQFGAGGGIENWNHCDPTLTNCTFYGNWALSAGAINNDGNSVVVNSIFREDKPDEIAGSAPIVTYSNVQGGVAGEGNIDEDPCFTDPGYWDSNGTPEDANDDFWVDGDYHLKSQAGRWDPNNQTWVQDSVTSLCIDVGDPNSPIGLEPFPNGGIINMGAYGGTAEASKSYFGKPPCETIVAGDINGDCIVNLKDFAIMAYHWLKSVE